MRKKVLLMLIPLILFLIIAEVAIACSCKKPVPPLESLKKSDAIFSGKVINKDTKAHSALRATSDPVEFTFSVSHIWKGSIDYKTVKVITASGEASCGYPFKTGESYLVYAQKAKDGFSTGICSRTKTLQSAQGDLQKLNNNSTPKKPIIKNDTEDTSSSNMADSLMGGIGLIILIIAGMILYRITNPLKQI